ncbi:MAG: hypothetical protein AAGF24_00145 [Cyanobacteria bacterium P01_H01_bin.121]
MQVNTKSPAIAPASQVEIPDAIAQYVNILSSFKGYNVPPSDLMALFNALMSLYQEREDLRVATEKQRGEVERLKGQAKGLQAQLHAIEDRLAKQNQLGACLPPGERVYIFANRNQCPGFSWYTLDENNMPVGLQTPSIRGYLTDAGFRKTQRFGDDVTVFTIELTGGDRRFVVESRGTANFTKSILMAIVSLSDEDIRLPIVLEPAPSRSKDPKHAKVLHCNVYDCHGEPVKGKDRPQKNDQAGWRQVAKRAEDRIRVVKTQ